MNSWKTTFLKDENWKGGWSLDEHTTESRLLPDGSFDNKYSELGSLLYQIKYQNKKDKIKIIAKKVCDYMKKNIMVTKYLSGIIPTPPSNTNREFQPVLSIAEEISKELGIQYMKDCLIKIKQTPLMKGINNSEEKQKIIEGAFKFKNANLTKNKKILLFDDIYETGITLREVAKTLKKEGLIQNLYVLTITKTRSKGVYQ